MKKIKLRRNSEDLKVQITSPQKLGILGTFGTLGGKTDRREGSKEGTKEGTKGKYQEIPRNTKEGTKENTCTVKDKGKPSTKNTKNYSRKRTDEIEFKKYSREVTNVTRVTKYTERGNSENPSSRKVKDNSNNSNKCCVICVNRVILGIKSRGRKEVKELHRNVRKKITKNYTELHRNVRKKTGTLRTNQKKRLHKLHKSYDNCSRTKKNIN